MSDEQPAVTPEAESSETIGIELKLTYDLRDGRGISSASAIAKKLADLAEKEGASVQANLVIGRKRFPL